ncbi:Photosystem I assembly protein Ycf3 [Candidatus Entotheonellaceae bacterium PAL068K]
MSEAEGSKAVACRCENGMRPRPHRRRRGGLLALLACIVLGCTTSPQVHREADARYQLAQSYLGNGSYHLAEQEVRKALDLAANEPHYYELLALIYQAQGRLHLAEEAYRMALKQTAVPPSVLVNYSTLLLLRERLDEAIVMAQRVLQNSDYEKLALVYTNLGLAYFKKGDLPQALEQLRTALEYRPDLPEAHHNLGLVYGRLQEPEKAIREFYEAIRYRSTYVEAHASLGRVLLEVGRTDEARIAFERVVTLAPNSDMASASREQLKRLRP